MKTALVVVDVQSYFLKHTPTDLPVKIADYILKSKPELVVLTVFQNQDGSNHERSLHWSNCKAEADLELAPELKDLDNGDNVFIKHTYSAFKAAGFDDYLRKYKIEKLELCGVDLEGCVLATAYEAFDKGYEVQVLFSLSYSRAGLEQGATSIILRDIQTKNEPESN